MRSMLFLFAIGIIACSLRAQDKPEIMRKKLEERNKLLQAERQRLERQLQELQSDHAALLEKHGQLEAQVQELLREGEALQKSLEKQDKTAELPVPADNEKQSQQLQQAQRELRAERERLRSEEIKCREQHSALTEKKRELEEKVRQLEKENAELTRRLETKDRGADPLPDIVEPPKPSRDWLLAESAAKVVAMRNLAEKIRGSWIVSLSKVADGTNQLQIIGTLEPTKLVGVKQLKSDFDFIQGMATVHVEIDCAGIIESIRRTNEGLSEEDYQELKFMFPEKVSGKGTSAWMPEAQKRLMAMYGAQLDARRKLVEQLRGVMIKSSTRMENFVVIEHQVVAAIESTLLIGVEVVEEKIAANGIAQVAIEVSRPMFIYSIRRGLEACGEKMTPEEYQNLRNMLSEDRYRFIGKAAVQ